MPDSTMIYRHLQPRVSRALELAPVVVLTGPRQSGKSTLVRGLSDEAWAATYFTLDDRTVLGAARDDPEGFLQGLEGPAILDEVQRAPELFRAVKALVDRDRRPGRLLLTGSANPLFIPGLADALVGRMRHLTLWPFTRGEQLGNPPTLLDSLFSGESGAISPGPLPPAELNEQLLRGGYPEPSVQRLQGAELGDWFESYLETTIQRTLSDLVSIERADLLPRLLSLIASRSGGLTNYADLSRSLGIPQSTLKRHITLLEQVFLVQRLPAWTVSLGRRQVKAPKLYLTDSGLMAHLLRVDLSRLREDRNLLGPLLEAFVVGELTRQAAFSDLRPTLHHYRSHDGLEIDLVIEARGGDLVGVEIKAAAQVTPADFKGLRQLQEKLPERFRAGIVLHTGQQSVTFGPGLHAVPMSALWASVTASESSPA